MVLPQQIQTQINRAILKLHHRMLQAQQKLIQELLY